LSRNLDPGEPAGFPWKKIILIVFVTGLCFVLGAGFGFVLLAKFGDFPSIESAAAYRPSVTSKIFDRNNRVVGEIYLEKRNLVPFKAIPPHVVNAFVAAEDANFFRHKGVDYIAIARAIVKDVLSGGYAQGASTITQQTVKSLFLTPEKTVARKLKELILAYRIERILSKEEILYLYLNQIYLGDGAYGVEAAAQTYFGRGVSTLTVAEGALLAGLAQAPTRYSPRGHIDKARARQRYVLRRMAEVGFLDAACRRCIGGGLLVPVVDTLQLARRSCSRMGRAPMRGEFTLDSLRKRYDLPGHQMHDALSDAIATAELFLAQAAELSAAGPAPLRALLSRM